MPDAPHKKYISWMTAAKLSRQLAARIKAEAIEHNREYTTILAIARGGLVPAAIIAQELNIRRIEAISVRSYEEEGRRNFTAVISSPQAMGLTTGVDWLVIDDIADSGETMKLIGRLMPKAKRTALYGKPDGIPSVHLYGEWVEQKQWLVFPWEPSNG